MFKIVERGYSLSKNVYTEIYNNVKSNRSLNWVLNNKQDSITLETLDDVTIASIYLSLYYTDSTSENELVNLYNKYYEEAKLDNDEYKFGIVRGIFESVNLLGFNIEGINI